MRKINNIDNTYVYICTNVYRYTIWKWTSIIYAFYINRAYLMQNYYVGPTNSLVLMKLRYTELFSVIIMVFQSQQFIQLMTYLGISIKVRHALPRYFLFFLDRVSTLLPWLECSSTIIGHYNLSLPDSSDVRMQQK